MDQKTLDKLPLATSSFTKLRTSGRIYVDKTALIYKLASGRNYIFLTRPRRFGKSLLVSTLESLFKNGVKEFEGLEIEGLWNDKTYKVVRLDFSGFKSFTTREEFERKLALHLETRFAEVGFQVKGHPLDYTLAYLSAWLRQQDSGSLVLLIDEYDAPLTSCLNKPELFVQIRSSLSDFYGLVKESDACWRFVFITGIAKFAKMSIFSAMNNLEDISLNPEYGALLGYTEDEVRRYFAAYIDNAVGKVTEPKGLDRDGILSELKRHYDGFCFGLDAKTQVYAPWSTLSFFKYPHQNFANYWYDSAGRPTMLLEYFKAHSFNDPEDYFAKKDIPMEALALSSGVDDIDDKALMTQAGYLTIKERRGNQLYVGYPNAEVRESVARLYAQQMLTKVGYSLVNSHEYKEVLGKEKGQNIFTMFNRLIDNLSYNFFEGSVLEAQVVSMYQLFMIGTGLEPHVENVSAKGRSDLQVTIADRHLVIEFKVQREGKTAETKLAEAVKQIIDNRYGEGSFAKEIFRLALVFSEKERRFVKWQEVPIQGN